MMPAAEIVSIHIGTQCHSMAYGCDVIIIQTEFYEQLKQIGMFDLLVGKPIIAWPTFYFPGFHPDLVYIYSSNNVFQSPVGDYHSSIVFHAWRHGLSVDQAEKLFCKPVFQHLGFFNFWETSKSSLLSDMRSTGLDLEGAFDRWTARGCFAFSVNHPKLIVLGSIANAILDKLGIVPVTRHPEDFLCDPAADASVWPVYPAIGQHLGIEGDYAFKMPRHLCTTEKPIRFLGLRAFIKESYKIYQFHAGTELHCDRLQDRAELYEDILQIATPPRRKGNNPYTGLPDFCFWRKGVAEPKWDEVDPVVQTKFKLKQTDRIATAGSCFAQHIARTLVKNGYNYFVAETAPTGMSESQAESGSYGLFSARYGNVYTARQLVQLIDRAYGRFTPQDTVWANRRGQQIDPFRPQVEKSGFPDAQAVIAARENHFAAVRHMFETTDVFVYTIGLTEAWRAKCDGAVFPVAPGAAAIALDDASYEFANFGVADIFEDLRAFIAKLQDVNPQIRLIVTVSPIPLVATYENRHVLVSTTVSKSVLRVVADQISKEFHNVDYFPSYEIITGNFNRGRYFEDDLREVKPEGVAHVMRLFQKHYFSAEPTLGQPEWNPSATSSRSSLDKTLQAEINSGTKVVCDEELLDEGRTRR